MENQSLLQKKLLDKVFVFTAETTPPDASDKETLLKNVMPLKGIADAVNVTDSPGAKVHMSSLTASATPFSGITFFNNVFLSDASGGVVSAVYTKTLFNNFC